MFSRLSTGLAAALIVALVACGTAGQATPTGVPGLVDVSGRLLYLTCLGEGSPTVVLEAGGEGNSDAWSPVQPGISEFTTVCAYDRAGEGFSDSVPAHEDIEAMVHDLHALLGAASIPGPYVLVGHSFGGRFVPAFAELYRSEVAGMVLVDPGQEGFLARAEQELSPGEWGLYMEAGGGVVARMQQMEGDLRVGPPGDIPLVVLSASRRIDRPGLSDDLNEKLHVVLTNLQRELAANSPQGTHITAENSGHGIQFDRPDLVLDAVRQVVEAVDSNRQ